MLKRTPMFTKDELMMSPEATKEDKEFAPLIRTFFSAFKNDGDAQMLQHPEIKSNSPVSPEEVSDTSQLSLNSTASTSAISNDGKILDLKKVNIKKMVTGPDCSAKFVGYAVSPKKARSLLQKASIKKTKKRKMIP